MIISLDLGTTGIRAIAYNNTLHPTHHAYTPIGQQYPHPAWVEQDPEEIRQTCLSVIADVIAKIGDAKIEALAITNQRESVLVWDKHTGTAIHPVISWQCGRTAQRCEQLSAEDRALIRDKTGLIANAYFSASKLEWLFQTYPDAKTKAERGELLFGTLDSYMIWVLSGGKAHVTDVSNASRTMLFDSHRHDWAPDLLALWDVPKACLPSVNESADHFADVDATHFGQSFPIMGVLGDQQAALFAQCGDDPSKLKNTYGTGLFLMAATGDTPLVKEGLLSTIAWQRQGQTTYAIEGSVFTGGSLIQWLRDDLELIQTAQETQGLAESVSAAEMAQLYLVPALNGLGCPHWDQSARGLLIGLTRDSKKAHIVRAALESLALQTLDVVTAIGQPFQALNVDGGASQNGFLMQFQADILGISVHKNKIEDATALGVAALAAIHLGLITEDAFRNQQEMELHYHPKMDIDTRTQKQKGWVAAIERSKHWSSHL